MQKSSKSLENFIILLFVIFLSSSNAFSKDNNDPNIKFLEKKLKKIIPAYKFDLIKKSPVENIYEVVYGDVIIYVTSDAKFIFEGGNLQKIIKEKNEYFFKNITEVSLSSARKKILDQIPDSKLFVYGDGAKYINVITDINCPYCRKFHNDIHIYEKKGIKVRYFVMASKPRLKEKIVSAWCASDRNKAFTLLKLEKKINKKACNNPIDEHQQLIKRIGVSSTPTIFLNDGTLILGYNSPDEIIRKLEN